VEVLDELDVRVTVFTWEPSGVWSTHNNIVRGETVSRGCNETLLGDLPNVKDREYTEAELWDNMK